MLISQQNTHVLPIVFVVECGVVNKFWRCSPISFKHVSLWCLFVDLHLSTCLSNEGVQLRKVTEEHQHAYLILVHQEHLNDFIFLCFFQVFYKSISIVLNFSISFHTVQKQSKASLTEGTWKKWKSIGLGNINLRATSHTRLSARDHYTSSTLIGGKGPVQIRFTLRLRDQRSIQVNARWMLKSTWIPTWHQMDYVSWSLGLYLKTTSWR